jgi:upstream activation factor subunit UAF30
VNTTTVVDNIVVASATTEKATKTKKTKTPKTDAVTTTPVVDVQTVTTTEDVVETLGEVDTPIAEQSIEFLAKLQQLGVLISALKTEYRTLEKKWTRELKTAQKQSYKRKRKAGNRAPSGFVKPTRISDELAKFLGKDPNTEMARTEVTRDINKYIRNHNLQDKENGRKINPDSKLATLLKLTKKDELTYFNLQRYMSPHFAKATNTEKL